MQSFVSLMGALRERGQLARKDPAQAREGVAHAALRGGELAARGLGDAAEVEARALAQQEHLALLARQAQERGLAARAQLARLGERERVARDAARHRLARYGGVRVAGFRF